MNLHRAYCLLVRLYPKDYRFRFAAQMSRSFQAAAAEHHRFGRTASARFIAAEFIGVLRGAAAEWITKWTTDASVRSRHLPDLRLMPLPWVAQDGRKRSLRHHQCSPDISQ